MEGKLRQTLSRLSEDLQNLTTQDLVECKWPIRRRMLLALFDHSPSLREFNEELGQMMAEREEEVSEQRAQNLAREERKESEMYFRAQFVRVVCNGLESIRWPPALEAFADPLVDLMNDKRTFFDAVGYILQVGGIQEQTCHHSRPSTPKSRPSSSSRPTSQPHTPSDRPKPSWDTSPVSHEFPEAPAPSGGAGGGDRAKQKKQGERETGSLAGWGSLEVSTISGASSATGLRKMVGRLGGSPSRATSTTARSEEDERQGQLSSRSVGGARVAVGGDVASLREALEALQAQNISLSRQLKHAHDISARRERAERSLELIITDLVRAVGSIAGLGGRGQGTSAPTSNAPSLSVGAGGEAASYLAEPVVDASFVTEEEDESFRREVEREEKEEADKLRDRRGTRVGGRGVSNYSVSREKGTDSSMSRGVDDCAKSNSRKASVPTANSKKVTSNLIFRQVHEQLASLQAQWAEALRDARSSFMEPVRLHRETSKAYLAKHSSESGNASRGPRAVRTHLVLGVRRPQSYPYESLEEDGMDSTDISRWADSGIWLDINRVQQLQSDLLAFAEEASAYAKTLSTPGHVQDEVKARRKGTKGPRKTPESVFGPSDGNHMQEGGSVHSSLSHSRGEKPRWQGPMQEGNNDDSDSSSSLSSYNGSIERRRGKRGNRMSASGGMVDVLPVSSEDAQRVHYMHILQEKASKLVLHLAALAPLAPLALHSPNSSSTTGLDCLINETNGLLDASTAIGRHVNKRSARVILEAGDRARAEMHALVRALDDKTAENDTWRQLALSMTPLLSTFGKNATGILHAGWTDVSEALSGVDTLLADMQTAEKSKINLKAQFNSNDRASHHTSDISSYSSEGATSAGSAVGGRGTGRRVNPLDALEEGYMGEEVAKLVISLRQQSKGLRELQMRLLAAKRKLHHDAVREIGALRTAKERLREKVQDEVALESDRRRGEMKEGGGDEPEKVIFASDLRSGGANKSSSSPRGTSKGALKPSRSLSERPPFEV